MLYLKCVLPIVYHVILRQPSHSGSYLILFSLATIQDTGFCLVGGANVLLLERIVGILFISYCLLMELQGKRRTLLWDMKRIKKFMPKMY